MKNVILTISLFAVAFTLKAQTSTDAMRLLHPDKNFEPILIEPSNHIRLQARSLLEAKYTYVGSFNVGDGPCWHDPIPQTYTAQEAAALIYGGLPSDYAVSINANTTDPNTITHTAWLDGYANTQYFNTPAAENYKLNDIYSYPAFSAFIKDNSDGNRPPFCDYSVGLIKTNYVWKVDLCSTFSCSINTLPTNNTYTGGIPTNIYIGYGPQSVKLSVNATDGAPYTYSWQDNASLLSCNNCAEPTFSPTGAGVYHFSVIVKNVNGCKSTCEVTICVGDVRCGNKKDKVLICHKGNSLCINPLSVPTHLNGETVEHPFKDKLGNCGWDICNPTASNISNQSLSRNKQPEISGFNKSNSVAIYPQSCKR